ncbi:MAG: hypothetical protein RLZZ444_402 [Pseudomonadota bacterium]|jgi:uncharacterized protein (DUF924 family)
MKAKKQPPLPTANQAEAILELWMSKKFDTHDIGRFLNLHESVVERTIHAARDTAQLLVAQAMMAELCP